MIPVVTPAEMQAIDAAAPEPVEELIARAGWHVARIARSMMGGVYGRRVVAVAGPGNNGADARIAGEILQRWGAKVDIVGPDTAIVPSSDLVIDGAFGTGANRPYNPPHVAGGTPILAVDIPSGVHGLTGEQLGAPLSASRTVSFAALKPGLLLGAGPAHSGDIDIVDIGLDTSAANCWQIEWTDTARQLPRRAPDAHKWHQAVYVVGGSLGMYGAPVLAANAALRTGAGMVWCGLPGQQPPPLASEVVFQALDATQWSRQVLADVDRFGALVIGCGMPAESGDDQHIAQEVATLTATGMPTVVDGGGIRALGSAAKAAPLSHQVVLTPHDGEFASLMGSPPGPDRFGAVRAAARRTGATVLLKGPVTIVAEPAGNCLVVANGDQRLATAGTGDVLAGVIGSLLAAGIEPLWAAAMGAWLHAAAANSQNPSGFVASDLLVGLGSAINDLHADSHTMQPVKPPTGN